MKLLFVADPLPTFKTQKDSTFAMMREAARRGHAVWACLPGALRWQKYATLNRLAERKAILVVRGGEVTVENIEFVNARAAWNMSVRAFESTPGQLYWRRSEPARTSCQLAPPSVERYTPRSGLGANACPIGCGSRSSASTEPHAPSQRGGCGGVPDRFTQRGRFGFVEGIAGNES